MKCIVKDCENHEHEGKFIGSICSPCHTYITKGEGKYSQAYRNAQRQWVGLTDEQKVALCKQFPDNLTFNSINAVEAKLKEKNT